MDGYHYTRNIGGKLVTKIVYGNIGKDFKVLDTYDSKLQFDQTMTNVHITYYFGIKKKT